MPNDKIMGIPSNPCINGITQKQSADIKTIPLLDERITALEQGGSGGGGKNWISMQITLESLNKYLPYSEEDDGRVTKTPIIFVASSEMNTDNYAYRFIGEDWLVAKYDGEYENYFMNSERIVVDEQSNYNATVDVYGFSLSLGKIITAIEENNTQAIIGNDFTYTIIYTYNQDKTNLANVRKTDVYYRLPFFRVYMYVYE